MNQPRFDYDARGRLILCSEGREVIGHDGGDESPRWLFRAEDTVVGVAITGAGAIVVDRVGAIVNLDDAGKEVARRQVADELSGLAFSSAGALALLGRHGLHLELPGGASRTLEGSGHTCAAFSASGDRLAVGYEDGRIRVLRLPGGERLGEHRLERAVADLCAQPDGGWLAASGDRVLRVEPDGSASARMTGLADVEICGVLMRADGRLLGIVYDRRSVVLLATPSLETVGNIDYTDKEVTSLAFGPQPWVGIGLSSGDGNKWNLFTGAMHRTDTHPEREHHSWLLMKSEETELAQRLLGAQAPAPQPALEALAPAAGARGPAPQAAAETSPTRKRWRRFPGWYTGVWLLLLALFLIFTLVYRLGGSGVSVGGAKASFDRKHDVALHKIDGERAFLLDRFGTVTIIKYCPEVIPIRPLCGLYKRNGSFLRGPTLYKKGDWVYTGHALDGGTIAFNLRTAEAVETRRNPRAPSGLPDPASIPFYREQGFRFDESLRLRPDAIARDYPALSTVNESCVIFTMAFVLLMGLWLIVGAPLLVRRRPR